MLKRSFDIVCSFFGLLLLSPLILILAWMIRRKLGGPVLFRQLRPGKNGAPFQMIKFRTMREATDSSGRPLPDSERMTPFGSFLRASSLDELPELWNVLKGEMSLVGPRPLLMQYLPLYTAAQNRRHEVRPGVTGWAQVNGRNSLSWDEKFKLDVWYVDNQSLWLDLRIIALTVMKVFMREGISADGEVTMPEFQGGAVKKLAILGCGGHARVVSDTAEFLGWESIEFFDDAWPNVQSISKWPVSGDTINLLKNIEKFDGVIVAIGDNDIRQSKINELNEAGALIVSLVHPTATVSRYAHIGKGVVAFAGVIVNAGAIIRDGTILNTGCSIDHDCILGECVHISPGARLAGNVNVGRCTWIGIGACVKQAINIGSSVKVGAGAAVVSNIASDIIVVGVPAKPLSVE